MTRLAVLISVGVVAAATVGWLLLREGSGTGRERVAAPSTGIGRDEASPRDSGAPSAPPFLRSEVVEETEQTAASQRAGADTAHAPSRSGGFNVRALEQAGYPPHDLEVIRRRWEEIEIRVRSGREPLDPNLPGVRAIDLEREQFEIDSEMRDLLGDPDYDAGRFATGQDNRVEIEWIPEDGLGVDLQQGDWVLEYNQQKIYTTDQYLELWRLDWAVGNTEPILTIYRPRDGRTFDVPVPSGQVGELRGIRVPPSP